MTRDEILNLKPGAELDRLVAELVMNWKQSSPQPAIYEDSSGGTHVVGSVQKFRCRHDNFCPSTDDAAAMRVVDALCDRGMWYTIDGSRLRLSVRVRFSFGDEVEATTRPLAICRAALLAVVRGYD